MQYCRRRSSANVQLESNWEIQVYSTRWLRGGCLINDRLFPTCINWWRKTLFADGCFPIRASGVNARVVVSIA
jgi:hypothetical protein